MSTVTSERGECSSLQVSIVNAAVCNFTNATHCKYYAAVYKRASEVGSIANAAGDVTLRHYISTQGTYISTVNAAGGVTLRHYISTQVTYIGRVIHKHSECCGRCNAAPLHKHAGNVHR